MYQILSFFQKPFFRHQKTLFVVWLVLIPIAVSFRFVLGLDNPNNFTIFRQMFWHAIEKLPLYLPYPSEYYNLAHYGVFFSLLIAPFAIFPQSVGVLLWAFFLCGMLFFAIRMLPNVKHYFIYWFCGYELATAIFMNQFNVAIAACIILAFVFVEREKDEWATFFILLGAFVKLYSIVGLVFFFFSKQKIRFIISFIGWFILFLVLPMLVFSPEYVITQYGDWLVDLQSKNSENLFAISQNISLLGFVRKVSGVSSYSDIWLILGGVILLGLPLLRLRQYIFASFRYFMLASTLLFVVLFSTGSESSSYIIAVVGVAIWYQSARYQRRNWDVLLMVLVIILTSLAPTDICPKSIRDSFIAPYAIKAVPCILVWLWITFDLLFYDFANTNKKIR